MPKAYGSVHGQDNKSLLFGHIDTSGGMPVPCRGGAFALIGCSDYGRSNGALAAPVAVPAYRRCLSPRRPPTSHATVLEN